MSLDRKNMEEVIYPICRMGELRVQQAGDDEILDLADGEDSDRMIMTDEEAVYLSVEVTFS